MSANNFLVFNEPVFSGADVFLNSLAPTTRAAVLSDVFLKLAKDKCHCIPKERAGLLLLDYPTATAIEALVTKEDVFPGQITQQECPYLTQTIVEISAFADYAQGNDLIERIVLYFHHLFFEASAPQAYVKFSTDSLCEVLVNDLNHFFNQANPSNRESFNARLGQALCERIKIQLQNLKLSPFLPEVGNIPSQAWTGRLANLRAEKNNDPRQYGFIS